MRKGLIRRIESFENDCQKEIKINDSIKSEMENYIKLIKSFDSKFTQWTIELCEIKAKFNDDYWNSMVNECKEFSQTFNEKQKYLENNLLIGKIKFTPNDINQCFGELKIEK